MARQRRPSPTGLRDQLRDYLQELPIQKAVGKTDRRSVSRVQRAEKEMSRSARASQIAEGLGISTQKWVAVRRQVRAGKIASPVLGDLLEQTRRDVTGLPQLRRIEYTADTDRGRRHKTGQIWVISSPTWIANNAAWMRDLKPGGFMDEKSAMNWWGNAGAGSQYFAMVRVPFRNSYRYHIYDMRTPEELSEKGEAGGAKHLAAVEIMEDESDEEYEE